MIRIKRWHVLERFINERGFSTGAEIGVFNGATLFYLLARCPRLHMTAVDIWRPYSGSLYSRQQMADAYKEFSVKADGADRLRVLWGDSSRMARHVADESLDFVFIDGDHSADGVRKDITAWTPKVRSTGLVFGHDIDWETVREAVTDSFVKWAMLPDDVWAARPSKYKQTPNTKQETELWVRDHSQDRGWSPGDAPI